MEYSTYWSVLDTPSKTIHSSSIFLYKAVGAGLLWFLIKKYKRNSGDGDRTILLWGAAAFGVLGAAGFVTLTFFHPDKSNETTLEMLNAPGTPRVEGVVSNFERTYRRARYGGETIEMFSIDSVQFAYSDATFGKFYSFTETHNNVIFNGQQVRITYRHDRIGGSDYNTILRLEIAK